MSLNHHVAAVRRQVLGLVAGRAAAVAAVAATLVAGGMAWGEEKAGAAGAGAGKAAAGQAAAVQAEGKGGKFDYAERTLANGLHIVALEDFNSPTVIVETWYHVGSKNEDPERQGFAHMFEHMMFRGTEAVGPGQFDRLLQGVGGENNAYTNFDQTVYYEKLPANQLDLALFLDADRMAALKIDQLSFDTERAVVEEERRQGLNSPYGTVFERVAKAIFKVHPYRWTPIGKIPHLRKATVEELARFWETYYVPNNATLVIVGAVKKEEALDKAERFFSWVPRGGEVPVVTVREPEQMKEQVIRLVEPTGPLPTAGYEFRGVAMAHPDVVPLQVALGVLADGESSRLYQLLVKEKEVAVEVSSDVIALEQEGLYGIDTKLEAGKAKPEDVLKMVAGEIEKLKSDGVTNEELEKVKLNLLKGQVSEAQGVARRAELLGSYAVLYGDLSRVNRRFDEIRAVTAADVKRVANTYLTEARRNAIIVEPATAGTELLQDAAPKTATPASVGIEEDGPAAVKREGNIVPARQGPKATAVRPESFPKAAPLAKMSTEVPKPVTVEKVLGNGLKVVVVPRHDLPLVTMKLGIKAGAATETDDSLGHASMAADLITQGTEHYDAKQLAEELEAHAIGLSAALDTDQASVNASCLTEQSDLAMKLLAEVTVRPTFPDKEFELARGQTLANMSVQEQEPKFLAERELEKRVFGTHPYSRPHEGRLEDVKKLERGKVEGWWKEHVTPGTSVLYIAGDMEPEAGFALAEKYLGDWRPMTHPVVVAAQKLPERQKTTIYLVDKPGLVQSEVRAGQIAMNRQDPRWGTVRVMSQMFGESFTSRLNESLRVKQGLTYGAFGYVRPEKDAGMVVINTFTKTQTTGATVQTIVDEVAKMHTEAIGEEELVNARNYLLGSFAGRRETAQDTVNDLWLSEYAGLPKDFQEQTLQAEARTEGSDVREIAKAVLDEKELTIVVVGDAAKVKAELEKIAPVVVVTEAEAASGGGGTSTQPGK